MSHPTDANLGYLSDDDHSEETPPPITGRRSFLRWLIHGMGAIVAVILGIPAIAYLIDPRNRASAAEDFIDVVPLSQLPINQPTLYVIRKTTRDAWTLSPNEIVGRVYLIRRDDNTDNPQVDAFTNICPHLGCAINYTGQTGQGETAFLCPCHGGRFDHQGNVFPNNVAPRDMDSLQLRYQPIKNAAGKEVDKMIQVQYKKFLGNRAEKVEMT